MPDDAELLTEHVAGVLARHGIEADVAVLETVVDMLVADGARPGRPPAAGTILATHQVAAPRARDAVARRAWLRDTLGAPGPDRPDPPATASHPSSGPPILSVDASVAPVPGRAPVAFEVVLGPAPGLAEAWAGMDAGAVRSSAAGFVAGAWPGACRAVEAVAEGFAARASAHAASLGDGGDSFLDALHRSASAALAGFRPFRSSAAEALARILAETLERTVADHAGNVAADGFRARAGYHDYPALFPLARSMRRRLTLLLGPTNSGKTHRALAIATAAPSARVLSPLRLLALEHYEALRSAGMPSGMVTGEEAISVEGASHVAHTIETAPLHRRVAVAVVDEVQMLADPERGWAWTQAIVGMPAEHLVMTGSPDAEPLVAMVASWLGEPLEVVRLERLSPLRAIPEPVPMSDVGRGDALVAFARRDVHALREAVVGMGLTVATVYGALSPEVRRAEARRFREGEADVLVATDAIGMGLNIGPLRRVILTSASKYDGERQRRLHDHEVRQVAGRAGRYGMQDAGYAGVAEGLDPEVVAGPLRRAPKPIDRRRLLVRPSVEAVRLGVEAFGVDRLSPVLDRLVPLLVRDSDLLELSSLDDMLDAASLLDKVDLDAETAFHYAVSPLDRRQPPARAQFRRWAGEHAAGRAVPAPAPRGDDLESLESASRSLTLYLWLGRRFPETYPDAAGALAARAVADAAVETLLVETSGARVPRQGGRKRGRKAA